MDIQVDTQPGYLCWIPMYIHGYLLGYLFAVNAIGYPHIPVDIQSGYSD